MRRYALLIAALLSLAAPAAAHAQAPVLRAKLTACAGRTATFTGSMPKLKGTTRMWMRFDLLARTPAADWAPLKAPGLSVWQKSKPGPASGFVFAQRVQGLVAPGSYKATVSFRWYGKANKLLRTTSRETAVCVQADPRPDLHAGLLSAAPGPLADQATYSLVVRNVGRGDAGPFDVALDAATQPVAGLAAGATWTVTFVGARCQPGAQLRFTLDSGAAVDEAAETDNIVTKPCPFAA
jgi:hypothetical protein